MSKVVQLDDYRAKRPTPPATPQPDPLPLWIGLVGLVSALLHVMNLGRYVR